MLIASLPWSNQLVTLQKEIAEHRVYNEERTKYTITDPKAYTAAVKQLDDYVDSLKVVYPTYFVTPVEATAMEAKWNAALEASRANRKQLNPGGLV